MKRNQNFVFSAVRTLWQWFEVVIVGVLGVSVVSCIILAVVKVFLGE